MNSQAQNALNQYRTSDNSSISYADPHELILRMMNGAIDRIAQAKGAILHNHVKDRCELISKSIAIVGSLSACLDHSHNSELSGNLEALYDYMSMRLLEANIENDVTKLDEVTRLLSEIRSAWVQMPK
jgi:flagellar secretion chaperone FliS